MSTSEKPEGLQPKDQKELKEIEQATGDLITAILTKNLEEVRAVLNIINDKWNLPDFLNFYPRETILDPNSPLAQRLPELLQSSNAINVRRLPKFSEPGSTLANLLGYTTEIRYVPDLGCDFLSSPNPLFRALAAGEPKIVQELLDRGADPNRPYVNEQFRLLFNSAQVNNSKKMAIGKEMVKLLILNSFDIDRQIKGFYDPPYGFSNRSYSFRDELDMYCDYRFKSMLVYRDISDTILEAIREKEKMDSDNISGAPEVFRAHLPTGKHSPVQSVLHAYYGTKDKSHSEPKKNANDADQSLPQSKTQTSSANTKTSGDQTKKGNDDGTDSKPDKP